MACCIVISEGLEVREVVESDESLTVPADLQRLRMQAQPADFHAAADLCESLAPHQQYNGFEKVMRLLGWPSLGSAPHEQAATGGEALWVNLLADSGAFESAAVALVPERATYTCGRLADGSHVAQVVLPSGVGAHSRAAGTLGMAVVAALLRAVGRDIAEARAVN